MTTGPDETALLQALVHVHRTPEGGLWVRVEGLEPVADLGRVPLTDLPVLLEALAVDASD